MQDTVLDRLEAGRPKNEKDMSSRGDPKYTQIILSLMYPSLLAPSFPRKQMFKVLTLEYPFYAIIPPPLKLLKE